MLPRRPVDGGRWSAWWWGGTGASVAAFLLAVALLGRAAQNMGQTTFPLVARQLLGVGNGLVGVMVAVAGVASVVTSATLTARSSPATAPRMVAAGQALLCAAFALFAIPSGLAGLWAAIVLLGVGGGLVFPATMTTIGAAPRGTRSRALAVYAVALSVGLTIGPLVESEVLRLLGGSLRATFAAMLPLPVVATALSVLGARRLMAPAPAAGDGTGDAATGAVTAGAGAGDVDAAAAGASGMVEAPPEPIGPVVEPRLDRPVPAPAGEGARPRDRTLLSFAPYRLSLATMLTYQAPFGALVTFGALLARHVDGMSAAGASLAFADFFTVSFVVRLVVVARSPVRHPRVAITAGLAATAVGVALLATATGPVPLFVGMAVLGAPHGLNFPLASALLAEGVPPGVLGRANARLMATANVVTLAVPFACGWLAGTVGYRTMFGLLEVPVAVFGILLLTALRGARPPGAAGQPASTGTGR